MEKGFFIAQTYTSSSYLPISGAVVTVSASGTDKETEVIKVIRTDINGKTELLELNAPDKNISLKPDEKIAFSTYDVIVEHPDFYSYLIRDVQIFSDTITLQKVEMLPIESGKDPSNASETYYVTPQNL